MEVKWELIRWNFPQEVMMPINFFVQNTYGQEFSWKSVRICAYEWIIICEFFPIQTSITLKKSESNSMELYGVCTECPLQIGHCVQAKRTIFFWDDSFFSPDGIAFRLMISRFFFCCCTVIHRKLLIWNSPYRPC